MTVLRSGPAKAGQAEDELDAAIADFKEGRFVVLVDDAERENEGDLVVAAQHLTAPKVNQLDRRAGGMFLLATTQEHLARLEIPLVEGRNTTADTPRFGVGFDVLEGITTGMSAADRAVTVAAAIRPEATPDDFVLPGHVLPLAARPEGLKARRGHTEGAVELARLAGLFPAAVMSEIMTEDGDMARGQALAVVARQLACRTVSIEQIARRVLG